MNLVTSMCELTSRKILEQAQEIDALYDTVVKAVEDIGEGRTRHIPSLPLPPCPPPRGPNLKHRRCIALIIFYVSCLRSGQRAASKGGRGIRVFARFHACLPLCCIASPPLSPLVHGLVISSAVSVPVDSLVLFMDLCALVKKTKSCLSTQQTPGITQCRVTTASHNRILLRIRHRPPAYTRYHCSRILSISFMTRITAVRGLSSGVGTSPKRQNIDLDRFNVRRRSSTFE
jgi:hypothetical protein